MRKLISLCLVLSCSTFAVWPQKNQTPVSRIPDADPFKIGRGTSFSASVPRTDSGSDKKQSAAAVTRDFTEALDLIRRHHVDGKNLDYNTLTKTSLTAMLRALDPHSNYFDPQEFQELLTEQQSEYFGIGAAIANYRKNGTTETYVTATFPDSPAFRAGLRFGDRIVSVDGESMTGKSVSTVRDKVRGKRGTVARLVVERAGRQETFELRRARVAQPSIPDAYILREGIGYIDLSEGFNFTTSAELNAALANLKKQGVSSLILDLRDNTGGILVQAVKVAEKFLPTGSIIASQKGRYSFDSRVWRSTNRSPETMPLVVLVNGSTASASEIVSGALQDHDRALIIGVNTFGKGLVQSIMNLPHGAGLTLTTAKYYTPSGRLIQRDYSSGNLYDYFNQKAASTPKDKTGPALHTATGRKVYGGEGISPDELVKVQSLNETERALLDPLFFFAVELAGGKFPDLQSFRISEPPRFGQRLRPGDFAVTDEVLKHFRKFLEGNQDWNSLAGSIDQHQEFIKTRLRFTLVTAAYGTVTANQVLVEEDPQIARAVEALPRAHQLAIAARRSWQKQQK